MAKKRKKQVRKTKRRINIKRLMIVLVILFAILFGLFKGIVILKNKIFPPKVSTQTSTMTPEEIARENEKIINIMIDPAKGGSNKGLSSKSKNTFEKDINLEIAKIIAEDLSKYKDVKVILSREYDEDIPIKERVKLAEENKIDLFISIKLNGQSNGDDANGIDTYYSNPTLSPSIVKSDSESDDSVEKSDDSTLPDTSSDTAMSSSEGSNSAGGERSKVEDKNEREQLSKKLATSIQENVVSFVKLRDRGTVNNRYDVLKYTKMPAVIVHCGFITNKNDSAILEDEDGIKSLSDGISSGILHFIDNNRNLIIADRINFR